MAGTSKIYDATLTPSKLELLQAWMAAQRWYVGKDHAPQLERVGSYRFEDPEHEVGMEAHLVLDTAATPPVLYQVPVTYRAARLPEAQGGFIGTTEHSVLGTRYVYDATHDPVYVAELVRTIVEGDTESTPSRGAHDTHVQGLPVAGVTGAAPLVRGSRVLSGEQSNTSIIVDAVLGGPGAPSRPLIVKLFRVLHPGDNPDVTVQTALAQVGSTLVPAPVGSIAGQWPAPSTAGDTAGAVGTVGTDGSTVRGHLAFAQEFLPGVQDAWRVALAAIEQGADFSERARALGAATGEVHRDLRSAMPTKVADKADKQALLSSMRTRYEAAANAYPALREHEGEITAILQAALRADWPTLQRIHGDYHLGQVLDAPGRGWVLLDFEGEPLRPLAERTLPDLPQRDVAGMLRSFDYAAGQHAQNGGDEATGREWAARARDAFLAGYAQTAGSDPTTQSPELLAALELDKALYEVVYEARNRPTWISIPVTAVERLVAGAPGPDAPRGGAGAQNSTDTSTDTSTSEIEESPMTASDQPTAQPTAQAAEQPTAQAAAQPTAQVKPASWDELGLLVHGGHGNPHGVLGAHPWNGGVTVRALRPMARSVVVELPDGSRHEMEHDFEGVWQVQLPIPEVSDYRLLVTYSDGEEHRQDDPYRFVPTVSEFDLHLIGEGRHEELWRVLGSHIRTYPGAMGSVEGTSFAVWAPNARAVRLIGSFNNWDGQSHPMRALGSSGVWELFVPGVGENATYKYEILGADGYRRSKADPLARATECPPATASVVTASHYEWRDEEWMNRRAQGDPINEPMSVYELHFGSWRQGLSYVEAAEHLVNYVKDAGFTHVEFLPLAEHPYGPSWGYQVTGYYAPTSRFGSPDELRHLIDTLHQNGIGVLMDWVPAHFPKDGFALGRFDGQPLYEHPDPRRGEHKDWGTYIFDFGRPQVRNFLVANACYWIEEFHVDGLRVDAVASMLYLDYSREDGEWLPNQFGGRENLEAMQLLQETNATVYKRYPGVVTVAEESTSWGGVTKPTYMGGLGFGLKWNMGWMHDSLGYAETAPVYRQYHHHQMTFSMVYQYSENFCLPISHDEVVYGKGSMLTKMPGDRWEQLAQLRSYYTFMWSHPGKQLIFMGSEFAQYAEWADGSSLDWWLLEHEPHWRMHNYVKALNAVYRSHPALWELDNDPAGFSWIDANDAAGNTFSWLRWGNEREDGERPVVAAVVNFSGTEHGEYRIGLPKPGPWRELLNSDAVEFGGGGVGNLGEVQAEEVPWHGQPYSAVVRIGKMASLVLEPGAAAQAGDEESTAEDAGAGHVADQSAPPRASTPGVDRPELRNAPVVSEDVVDSGLGELPPVTDRD